MALRRAERCILTSSWSFGFGFLNWNERFWVFESEERWEKLSNERGRYGGWDDAKDAEMEKRRGNLGTEDRAGSECTKMIKLFILKVDFHISHCWVLKMLLCWDGKAKAQLSQNCFPNRTITHIVLEFIFCHKLYWNKAHL